MAAKKMVSRVVWLTTFSFVFLFYAGFAFVRTMSRLYYICMSDWVDVLLLYVLQNLKDRLYVMVLRCIMGATHKHEGGLDFLFLGLLPRREGILLQPRGGDTP